MIDLNHWSLLTLILFSLLRASFNTNANSTIKPLILNFYTKASNDDNFTESNYNSHLYSHLVFGSDKQKVEMRLSLNSRSTYITQKSIVNPLYNLYIYDNTTSTSYKFIKNFLNLYDGDYDEASISNETLLLQIMEFYKTSLSLILQEFI